MFGLIRIIIGYIIECEVNILKGRIACELENENDCEYGGLLYEPHYPIDTLPATAFNLIILDVGLSDNLVLEYLFGNINNDNINNEIVIGMYFYCFVKFFE